MPITSYLLKLLGLSQAFHSWSAALATLEAARRAKIALYADAIAATFARAAAAFAALERDHADARALREAIRELGRITGYMEDIVTALEDHLDGRKLAGVKRRLEALEHFPAVWPSASAKDTRPAKTLERGSRSEDVEHPLPDPQPLRTAALTRDAARIDRLVEAEGYFRALADGLRT